MTLSVSPNTFHISWYIAEMRLQVVQFVVVFGGLSVLLYKPWRRRIDRKRERRLQPQHLQHDKELGTLPELKGAYADLDPSHKDRETPSTANDVKGTLSLLEPEAPPTFGSCQGAPSQSAVEQ